MTVIGVGLSQSATVTVGGEECVVVHASETELKCRTPAVSLQTDFTLPIADQSGLTFEIFYLI